MDRWGRWRKPVDRGGQFPGIGVPEYAWRLLWRWACRRRTFSPEEWLAATDAVLHDKWPGPLHNKHEDLFWQEMVKGLQLPYWIRTDGCPYRTAAHPNQLFIWKDRRQGTRIKLWAAYGWCWCGIFASAYRNASSHKIQVGNRVYCCCGKDHWDVARELTQDDPVRSVQRWAKMMEVYHADKRRKAFSSLRLLQGRDRGGKALVLGR